MSTDKGTALDTIRAEVGASAVLYLGDDVTDEYLGTEPVETADSIDEELAAGRLVCILPEGAITHDGKLQPFRPGIERIVAQDPVPVVPMALVGMWGSFFSRWGGRAMSRPFRRFWSRVEVRIGDPVPPDEVTADGLAERVAFLGNWKAPDPIGTPSPSPSPTPSPLQRQGQRSATAAASSGQRPRQRAVGSGSGSERYRLDPREFNR